MLHKEASLRALLAGMPRRAGVSPEGRVVPASSEVKEVPALSRICEVVRERYHESPHISRCAEHLLTACLESNVPEAWAALRDDLQQGHMVVKPEELPDRAPWLYVACLKAARSVDHVLALFACFQSLLTLGSPTEYAAAFRDNLGYLAARLGEVAEGAPEKAAFCSAAASVMQLADVVSEETADSLQRHPGMAWLLCKCPVALLCVHRPDIPRTLVQYAKAQPVRDRYGVLAALARVHADNPRLLDGLRPEISVLATHTLQKHGAKVDARLLLVIGVLLSGSSDPLIACLASSLRTISTAYLKKSVT